MQKKDTTKRVRFGEVLDRLKELGISNGRVGRTISEKVEIVLDKDAIRRYKKGERTPSEEIIKVMKECYNVNPHYMLGTSDVMFDILDDDFQIFSSLAKDWKMGEKKYVNKEGKRIKKKYLELSMKKVLYDFLVEVGYAKKLKEMGMQSYNEEFMKYKESYGKEKADEYSEYIILPKKVLYEIVQSEIDGSKKVEEILDFCQFDESK